MHVSWLIGVSRPIALACNTVTYQLSTPYPVNLELLLRSQSFAITSKPLQVYFARYPFLPVQKFAQLVSIDHGSPLDKLAQFCSCRNPLRPSTLQKLNCIVCFRLYLVVLYPVQQASKKRPRFEVKVGYFGYVIVLCQFKTVVYRLYFDSACFTSG